VLQRTGWALPMQFLCLHFFTIKRINFGTQFPPFLSAVGWYWWAYIIIKEIYDPYERHKTLRMGRPLLTIGAKWLLQCRYVTSVWTYSSANYEYMATWITCLQRQNDLLYIWGSSRFSLLLTARFNVRYELCLIRLAGYDQCQGVDKIIFSD
jgi:hypothetical protein